MPLSDPRLELQFITNTEKNSQKLPRYKKFHVKGICDMCWGCNELLWLHVIQISAFFGVVVRIMSAVMSYPIFSPSYPFLSLNTNSWPSKHILKHVFFGFFPPQKWGGGLVTCPNPLGGKYRGGAGYYIYAKSLGLIQFVPTWWVLAFSPVFLHFLLNAPNYCSFGPCSFGSMRILCEKAVSEIYGLGGGVHIFEHRARN